MYVTVRLGAKDHRKSTNLQLVPAVFVVWKSTKHSPVSAGFQRERPAASLQKPSDVTGLEVHSRRALWQTEGDVSIGCCSQRQ